jgi:hypothetical protein
MKRINRRTFISTSAATPVAARLAAQTRNTAPTAPPELTELTSGDMVVSFDRDQGVLYAIRSKSDPLGSNFIGNSQNTRRIEPGDSQSLGDVVMTVWAVDDPERLKSDLEGRTYRSSGGWQRETTGASADIRSVYSDGKTLQAEYAGKSSNAEGLRSCDLRMSFGFAEEGVLLWDITLKNTTGLLLEIGELAFPFLGNEDYGYDPANTTGRRDTAARQRLIHEQKVLSHHYVGGHSSYSFIQRPMAEPPFLLMHPVENTSFECIYKSSPRGRRGPDLLAVHSHAQRDINRWRVPWVNGHTSLVLKPGESRQYRLRFKFIQDYQQIRDQVFNAGNVAIRIVPSMVVQEGSETYVELRSKQPLESIETESDGIVFKSRRRVGDRELLTLAFKGRGQKSIALHHTGQRCTRMHFFCVDDIAQMLKTRGRFIIERQWYENPDDPYNRHHMFLPFDYDRMSTFTDSQAVWEVGGSDEFGFSEALFLAEKNIHYPSRDEVARLETYVTDCLFKHIQNPKTFTVRASLYWKERTPSSPWSHWTERRSESQVRTYNYAHPTNIYYALYKIGQQYDLLTHRKPLDYLRMAYRTAMVWFVTGSWQHIGIMCGSNVINVLEDLKKEGWSREYDGLRARMQECLKVMVRDPYPYSSELTIDQTAHEQVYFFTKYFGETEKNAKTMRVIKALRGGNEPLWFRYGNDRRHWWSTWYSESLNGMALLDGFEQTGDPDMFIKGFAGVMSVAANLLPDGMCFCQFVWAPGIFRHFPPTTREGGQGQWGFMKSARSFILHDGAFGLIGAGCQVEEDGEMIRVVPRDGLRKTVLYPERKLRVVLTQGEIDWLTLDQNGRALELSVVDTTGLVKQAQLRIEGLVRGSYRIRHGRAARTQVVSESLELSLPIDQAKAIRINLAGS